MINRSIKHLTIQLMTYLNMTASEKELKRIARKKQVQERESYSSKWFGMLPYMWRTLFKVK